MSTPKIILIAAHDNHLGIGKNNSLPWKIPLDMKLFKDLTVGKPTIMGRKTFESVITALAKPLPNRINIVVSSKPQSGNKYDNVIWTNSTSQALDKAREVATKTGVTEICVAGGGQIYQETLDLADKLFITVIEGDFQADTFFPSYQNKFKVIFKSEKLEQNGYKFYFLELEKI